MSSWVTLTVNLSVRADKRKEVSSEIWHVHICCFGWFQISPKKWEHLCHTIPAFYMYSILHTHLRMFHNYATHPTNCHMLHFFHLYEFTILTSHCLLSKLCRHCPFHGKRCIAFSSLHLFLNWCCQGRTGSVQTTDGVGTAFSWKKHGKKMLYPPHLVPCRSSFSKADITSLNLQG